jgi:O-antigen/teichoic acid export membrane protein
VIRLFTFLVGVLVILVTFKLSRVDNLLLILGVFTAQFILLADQSFRSVVDSRDLSQRFSLTDLIGKLLLTASLYIGVWLHLGNNQNLALYILASILIYLGVYFLDQVINHKFTHFTGFKLHILKENLKSLIYLALPGFIFVGSLDQIFLEYFGTDKFTFNGYANASKIFQTAAILPALIVPVIASRLKIKIKTFTSEQIKANSSRYLIYLGSIGFIYCGLIYLFSPLIFKILDPKDLYSRYSLVVMPWFCLALFTQFINFFYYNLNIFIHREKLESVYYYIYSICLLFSIFVCLKLFGYIGGGIAFAFISYLDLIVRLSLLRPILSNENQ